jgi:hypothetical protein
MTINIFEVYQHIITLECGSLQSLFTKVSWTFNSFKVSHKWSFNVSSTNLKSKCVFFCIQHTHLSTLH